MHSTAKPPPDQDAFIQSLIAHRSSSPQKLLTLLANTPPDILACLSLENDPLDHLILPHSDPIPFFHILISRLQNCPDDIDPQKTLSQVHLFCTSVNRKQLHLISPTNAERESLSFIHSRDGLLPSLIKFLPRRR